MKPKKGDKVDCQDSTGRWARGAILDITPEGALLHYDGFKKIYDEVIPKSDWATRFAPRGQYTGVTASRPKKPKPADLPNLALRVQNAMDKHSVGLRKVSVAAGLPVLSLKQFLEESADVPPEAVEGLEVWLESLPKQQRRAAVAHTVAAEPSVSHKQQKAMFNSIIATCSKFSSTHFLRQLSSELAEFDALIDEKPPEAAIRKAERSSDCRRAVRQLQCALESQNNNTGPSYVRKKNAVCEVCDLDMFKHCILTCDRCERVMHTMCLPNPIARPPQGLWFCPACQAMKCPCEECGGDGTKEWAFNPVKAADAPPPPARSKPMTRMVDEFHLEGFCLLNKGLSAAQVSECADHCEAAFQHNIHTVNILGLGQTLEDVGFSTFKLRNRGRYDFTVESLSSLDFLGEKAPWMPLVRELLGHDCVHLHTGCMLSMPGSETQKLHSDGDHVSTSTHLSPHLLNVFVPLVDLVPKIGPTEFIARSHFLWNFDCRATPVQGCCKAGQAILFDYRLKHRGLGNNDLGPRPVLYFTYSNPTAKSKFEDAANFNKKRYRVLPALKLQESTSRKRTKTAALQAAPAGAAPAEPPSELQDTAAAPEDVETAAEAEVEEEEHAPASRGRARKKSSKLVEAEDSAKELGRGAFTQKVRPGAAISSAQLMAQKKAAAPRARFSTGSESGLKTKVLSNAQILLQYKKLNSEKSAAPAGAHDGTMTVDRQPQDLSLIHI
eukprot:TRINITY_DN2614_c0_g1_i2.p1 TRINITY_DN2614_c0_g1~~TRINITY_DN2614_c0_g1_i2.p1  ORF type:complete len:723 (-),score=164.00 TRINITY_DN2614_c0_g1_i2:131-2299(-)